MVKYPQWKEVTATPDLNSRSKNNKNINQNKLILVKIFRGIIVSMKDTTQ